MLGRIPTVAKTANANCSYSKRATTTNDCQRQDSPAASKLTLRTSPSSQLVRFANHLSYSLDGVAPAYPHISCRRRRIGAGVVPRGWVLLGTCEVREESTMVQFDSVLFLNDGPGDIL